MRSKIVTNAEMALLAGVSNNATLSIWNDIAHDILYDLLQVSDLGIHTVTDERQVLADDSSKLFLCDYPVDLSETITVKNAIKQAMTGISFTQDPNFIKTINVVSETTEYELSLPKGLYFVSYTAGYILQDTVVVLDYASLDTKTITVEEAGVTTTWTFVSGSPSTNEIQAATSNEVTAANIATALGGTASSATVTLPLGTKVTLGTATSSELTITNNNIPSNLKLAISLIAAGGLQEKQSKGGAINSYSLGDKSVTFRTDGEANTVKIILEKYLSAYRPINISGI